MGATIAQGLSKAGSQIFYEFHLWLVTGIYSFQFHGETAGSAIWISFHMYNKSFALHSTIVGCLWKLVKRQKICGRS